MTIRMIARIVLICFILSIFLVASVSAAQLSGENVKAPDLALKSPAGETTSLAAYIGKKPVLLVFWASWCTDCQAEIPLLKKLNSDRFKVIAVNEGESAWKTKRFVSTNNIEYQVVLDPDGSIAKAFQVPGVPAVVIINKSGFIVYRKPGMPEQIEIYTEK
jgi:peroxiredoxin